MKKRRSVWAPHQHHAYRLCEDAKHCPSPAQVPSLDASEQKSVCFEGFTPLNLDPTTRTQIPWSRSLYHWSITNGKGAHRVLFFLWNDWCLRCSTLVVWETPEIHVFFDLNQFQLSKDGSIISIFISIYIIPYLHVYNLYYIIYICIYSIHVPFFIRPLRLPTICTGTCTSAFIADVGL